MNTANWHPMKRLLPLAATLILLVVLLSACEGGDKEDGDTGPSADGAPTSEARATDRADQAEPQPADQRDESDDEKRDDSGEGVSRGEIGDLSPEDILTVLPSGWSTENLLYADVQQAIKALEAHSDIRAQFKEEWDVWGLSEGFGIEIAGLDFIAFGEAGSPDDDVFLIGGADLGDLRDTVDALGFQEVEFRGVELWVEGEDSDNETPGSVFAFFGDTVFITEDAEEMREAIQRLAGDYEVFIELLPALSDGAEGAARDFASHLNGNPGLIATFLQMLPGSLKELVGNDVDRRFEEATGADLSYARRDIEEIDAFSNWIAEEREALEDTLQRITEDQDALRSAAEFLEKSKPFHHRGGDVWNALPDGIATQMRLLDPGVEGQTVERISNQSFLYTRIIGLEHEEDIENAAQQAEYLEEWEIHEACEAPTVELEGIHIRISATCDVEALVAVVDVR